MNNQCMNRLQITANTKNIEALHQWAKGKTPPNHLRAVKQSIKFLLAGHVDLVQPTKKFETPAPYPYLSPYREHVLSNYTKEDIAYTKWLRFFNQNASLSPRNIDSINRWYQESQLAKVRWYSLSAVQREMIWLVLDGQYLYWSYLMQESRYLTPKEFWDALDAPPSPYRLDFRVIKPSRLNCHINGTDGKLLIAPKEDEFRFSLVDRYLKLYSNSLPYGLDVNILHVDAENLVVDFDTSDQMLSHGILESLSKDYQCRVEYMFYNRTTQGVTRYENGLFGYVHMIESDSLMFEFSRKKALDNVAQLFHYPH
ncbi:DUF1281 domain-containing protein [Zophobihabitans entericus]|uniref:DUF1281 domain-containing protein n=1 Tax=Zophobihabitans entericus TaxID=1635327 RepID=A0A6G9IE88_9GAMM|nr:DUF1281 domain-containing protein [Zophobihabitans entericus]QIQ22132.1 DUF1281 domain-containing protein [Zophobihabitans entericus]